MEVNIEEDSAAIPEGQDLEETFKEKCEKGVLYQLEVQDLDIMASMTSCYYFKTSGLNDTISIQTDTDARNIVGMQFEVKDIKHLASLEKNPKKRRLMQER